ncbi:hypothetical protein BSN85_21855 [Bradyrhizobium brasilense]|nr:hypothetical protein BSN85_21855 [Bradyrhizobium brasilense]
MMEQQPTFEPVGKQSVTPNHIKVRGTLGRQLIARKQYKDIFRCRSSRVMSRAAYGRAEPYRQQR